MPLDIDGAGRSRTLACLPTARGTVAPKVPGRVFLGTSTGPLKSHYPKAGGRRSGRCWLVFPGGPPLRANFGTRGPESQHSPGGLPKPSQGPPRGLPRASQRPTTFFFSFTHQQQKVARPPPDLFQALRTFSGHK